jgi:lipopolysaccharide transport system ATP-binding protein
MKDVSVNDGRTVLFVSHNMAAVAELCNEGIVLVNGKKVFQGNAKDAISMYKNSSRNSNSDELICDETNSIGNDFFSLQKLIVQSLSNGEIDLDSGFSIEILFKNFLADKTLGLSIVISNDDEIVVFEAFSLIADNNSSLVGNYNIKFSVPGNLLNSGKYFISLIFAEGQRYVIFKQENIITFNIENKVIRAGYNLERIQGIIRPDYQVELKYNDIN